MRYALLGRYYPATSVVLHAVAQDIELPVVNHLADTAMLFLRYRMGSGGVAGFDIDTQHQILRRCILFIAFLAHAQRDSPLGNCHQLSVNRENKKAMIYMLTYVTQCEADLRRPISAV